MFCQCTRW